ncbi:MAG: T9SS type A sorting domain-containing protein [Flavobacteriales bacterium]|nr:T9SS type A sorting domain-containing protein [Flavobacteriales bacterium]
MFNLLYQKDYTIYFDDCPNVKDERTNRLVNNAVNLSDDVRKIKVYPNPSNGIIYIEVLDNTMRNTSLTIEDVSGKILYNNANLQLNGNIEQLNIKVDDGIYFVKVKDNITGKITVEKIVISNR